jgi:hypothetical protein
MSEPSPQPAPPSRPPTSWRTVFLFLVAGILFVAVVASMLFFTASRVFQGVQGKRETMTRAVDGFLRTGAGNDAAAARGLFSRDAEITPRDIENLFRDHREIFEGYEEAVQVDYQLNSAKSTTGGVSGNVKYRGKPDRFFVAELKWEEKAWKLLSIHFMEGLGHRPAFKW